MREGLSPKLAFYLDQEGDKNFAPALHFNSAVYFSCQWTLCTLLVWMRIAQ